MDRVRIGVIGVGGQGLAHCAALEEIPESEFMAVCDTDESALDEATSRHKVDGFPDACMLLRSSLVDAVIIATPHYDHAPIAIEAFKNGIHVLTEKPIAVTVSAADEMIAAARESGCKFGVVYQMRSLGRCQAARKMIQEGRIGDIYRTSLVMGWYRSQAYYDSGGWRATWAGEGGGVLINQAPHFLDLFAWLAGSPSRVTGQTRTRMHDIEVEDEAFAALEYPNGAHGYLYASTTEMPQHEMLEICGNRGKLVMHGSSLRVFEVEGGIRGHSTAARGMWDKPEVNELTIEMPEGGGQHSDMVRNFCRAILYDEPLTAPGEEGILALELINGIILSSHTGQPIDLPVARARYDELILDLKRSSRAKSNVRTQRVTDAHFAGNV